MTSEQVIGRNVILRHGPEISQSMCWGFKGHVLFHSRLNPDKDPSKPFICVLFQDKDFMVIPNWQMHFVNFDLGKEKDENALEDLLWAVGMTSPKGLELFALNPTPGGISGISRLKRHGFRKVFLPITFSAYWGGRTDSSRLDKWLRSGEHDDEFLIKSKDGSILFPSEAKNEIPCLENTLPRPFKMVKES